MSENGKLLATNFFASNGWPLSILLCLADWPSVRPLIVVGCSSYIWSWSVGWRAGHSVTSVLRRWLALPGARLVRLSFDLGLLRSRGHLFFCSHLGVGVGFVRPGAVH